MSFGLMYESTIARLSLISENLLGTLEMQSPCWLQEVGMKRSSLVSIFDNFVNNWKPKPTRLNGESLCGWFRIAVGA